ncbi:MAG TPA: type II toxin-antitoxin system VapC family toxin [Deltaproteobacteria bacterium]|nr:type II toxin-antitoxin system VapC family toxin [Deltaproteobacteria bacterium]
MYLFDTDVLSNIVKRNPSPVLLEKLGNLPKKLQFTSAINVGEIYYGANRSNRKDQIINAFKERVFPKVNIIAFDETGGKLFGKLKAELEKQSLVCSEPDLRIASIALQHDLKLITGNTKHFIKIPGLSVENWIGED